MTRICFPSPQPEIDTGISLQVLADDSRAEALSIWRRLEADLQSARLTSSSIWTETWLNHFGNQIPHQFIVGYRGGVACGICLITHGVEQRNGPMRIRTWHLGTAGEVDADSACVEYNTLLVRREDRSVFKRALWDWVRSQGDWNEFRLDGFCDQELSDWPRENKNWSTVSRRTYYYDLATIRDSSAEPLASLGSKTRSVIRQNLRRSGPVTPQWAETIADAEDIFAELILLHQARWNADGFPGAYSSKLFREFHMELLHRLVPLGLMGLFRVRGPQGTIGCAQALIDNNRACMYQSGRVLNSDPHCSPGVILDYLVIEECRRRGLDAVDFLAGETAHKRRLSTNSSVLNWVVCRRPSFKHRVVDGLRSVKHIFLRTFQRPGLAQSILEPQHAALNELDC